MAEKRFLTADEAISLLNDGESIHTFVNPNGAMLVGADWDRKDVIKILKKNSGEIEIGGNTCREMKHAIVVWRGDDPLFIEHNEERMNAFDPITETDSDAKEKDH